MTHVLVSSLTEIMECVTAVLGWLVPALAVSPARHPRGSCQHLCSPPALHTTQATLHSPRPGSHLLQHIFLAQVLSSSTLARWQNGVGRAFDRSASPWAKFGSIIIWQLLIQHALKIPQWRGCRDLPQSAALADRDWEGTEKFWEGKNESPRRGEGDVELYRARSQCMSHLDVSPTSMEPYRLFFLRMMYTL